MNTHPALILACIDACKRRGASRIMVGDNSGSATYGNVYNTFLGNGGGELYGEYYVNLGLNLTERRVLPTTGKEVWISRTLTEADVVISLPKLKTHSAVGLTGAIKNQFGYLAGAQKAGLHVLSHTQERFARTLVEVMMLRRPDAFIVDAIALLHGSKFPDKGIKYAGKLICSTDPVAADAVMCDMMGVGRRDVHYIAEAEKMGVGTTDYTSNVPAEAQDHIELPPVIRNGPPTNQVDDKRMQLEGDHRHFTLDEEKCTRCGKCVEQCPVKILHAKENGVPYMDPTDEPRCVTCFACMEVCQDKCLVLRRIDR